MKTCYIYLRVSTEEQAEGFSINNQRRACIDYAHTQGFHVVNIFVDDGRSGRNTDRPAFQELFAALKKQPADALIIYKIDRLARNVADFANIRKELKNIGN